MMVGFHIKRMSAISYIVQNYIVQELTVGQHQKVREENPNLVTGELTKNSNLVKPTFNGSYFDEIFNLLSQNCFLLS